MEIISAIFTIVAIGYAIQFVIGLIGKGTAAVTGTGEYSKFQSMSSFQNGKLTVKYKGCPKASGYISHYITLTDKETNYPIQTFIPELTDGNSSMFQLIVPHPEPITPDAYWTDWVTALPEFELSGKVIRCPRQGLRDIKVTVMITTGEDHKIFAEDSTFFQYEQKDRGLLDKVEDTPKIRKQIICFAMAMAFSDGNADKKEAKIIQDWAKKKVESETDSAEKSKLKETLNKEIEMAYKLGKEGKLNLRVLIENFNKISDLGDKWELMELLRDVMSADGEADNDELVLLRDLQVQLGIDPEEFNKMMNEAMKKIKTVGTSATSVDDKKITMENLIGIDPTWSIDQKKAHLAKQNNMFNNLANVADNDEERENANKMLENIAQYRKDFL